MTDEAHASWAIAAALVGITLSVSGCTLADSVLRRQERRELIVEQCAQSVLQELQITGQVQP